jgi:tetratricopeptide (TPR) repeat protein
LWIYLSLRVLAPFDQGRVEVHLKRKCNIILHGHGHKPGVSEINDNFGYYVVIPAGACYDRRSTADLDHTFSYNFVHLDLDANKGTVFLRRWSDQNREWRKDDDTCPEGKRSFSILRKEKVQIPHQIPTPPQDFTGRDDDLKELLDHFEQGATITGLRGMGGIGKTALAYKLAEKLNDRYPDGQVLVDMKGTSDEPMTPAGAMAQVIRAFDPEVRTQENESELAGLYRSKLYGKRVLILLDNAIDDNQVRHLLPPASCGLIVTSREKFTLPGLKEKNLNIMNSPDACALLLKIAKRIGDHADELAKLCGYLPLALRAAGSLLANTNDLSPAEYAKQLHAERTRLERIGSVGVDLDVEASFNLSYHRLKPEIAQIFRMLSIFPSDFDANAEEFICKDRGHKSLSVLVRWSLVDFHAGNGSYLLHDLARIFAKKRLNKEDGAIVRFKTMERYALRYLNILKKANEIYIGGKGNILLGLELFDREWSNIQAAQIWAEKNAKGNNKVAVLCDSYAGNASLLALRLHPHSLIRWHNASLNAAKQLKKRSSEGAHLGNLGLVYDDLGETRKAIKYHEQALAIHRDIGDKQGESANLGNIGNAYAHLGETRKAIEYYEQALAITREIRSRRGEGTWLGNLGNAYANLGETRKAIQYYEQALTIEQVVGDKKGEGTDIGNLGNTYANLGETRKAIQYYEQALAIHREIGYRQGESTDLSNLGEAYYDLGEIQTAIEYHEQALSINKEIGNQRGEGIDLGNIGLAYAHLGETRKAIECCEQALAIHREIEYKQGEGVNLGNLGIALAYSGETQKAIDYCELALAIHREMGDRLNEGEILSNLCEALYLLDEQIQAIEFAEKALSVYEEIENPKSVNIRQKLAEWKEKRQAN